MEEKLDLASKDKLQHMGVSAAVVFIGSGLLCLWMPLGWAVALSCAFAAGLALGKEEGDKRAAGNHWCWWDLLADAIGIAAGAGAIIGLYALVVAMV